MYTHVGWDSVEQMCLGLYYRMLSDKYEPNCIIGLMKGGIVPARLFADYFDVPVDFYALNVSLYNGINSRNEELVIKEFHQDINFKNILIIDDIWDTGKTMKGVLDYMRENTYHEQITTATLYYKEGAVGEPDYCSVVVPKDEWVVFPWEKFDFEKEKRKLEGKN